MLALLFPVMLILALAVKLSSPGPIFFRQRRCGKNGACFDVLKFRTMTHGARGVGLTRAGDARVTRIGRILRKWKLDEFPQLVNVLRGEMSLVGPRPDVPEYFEQSSEEVQQVLKLTPGISGWASIHFRNEEELLTQAHVDELQEFYVTRLLPLKARLDLQYAAEATLLSDIAVLLRTVGVIVPLSEFRERRAREREESSGT